MAAERLPDGSRVIRPVDHRVTGRASRVRLDEGDTLLSERGDLSEIRDLGLRASSGATAIVIGVLALDGAGQGFPP